MVGNKQQFTFYKARYLLELTGRKAETIHELLDGIRKIDESSLFNHIHHALLDHHFVPLEYPNDFAYWIADVLHEPVLAEKIADIDLRHFNDIGALRNAIINEIQGYVRHNEVKGRASTGQEFHFVKCTSFIFPSRYTVRNIAQAVNAFREIDTSSIFYHFVAHRFLSKDKSHDFMNWIGKITGDSELVNRLKNIDPYGFPSMGELKKELLKILESHIKKRKK